MNYLEIYNALVNGDEEFVAGMARAALRNAADIEGDMWSDEPNNPAPDAERIKDVAKCFTEDMVKEFSELLVKRIDELKIRTTLNLNVTVKFD